MLSGIPGRDNYKIILYDWSRILFKFSKKMISVGWCIQMRCFLGIQAFDPWKSCTFPSALYSHVIQMSHGFIMKYISSACYSGVILFNISIDISPQLKKTRSRGPDLGSHGGPEMRKMSRTETWKALWSMNLRFRPRSSWAYSRPRSGWRETALTGWKG